MDVIAALFPDDHAATSASQAIRRRMHLATEQVVQERLGPGASEHAGEVLLLVYVDGSLRRRVRTAVARHAGRHAPFDWVQDLLIAQHAPA